MTEETDLARAVRTLYRAVGVFLVVAVCGCLAVVAVFWRLGQIAHNQDTGVVRGYKQRTVPCVALLSRDAGELPRYCVEPDALPYLCVAVGDVDPAWVQRVEEQAGRACHPPSG